ASAAALRAQHALQMKISDAIKVSHAGRGMAVALSAAVRGTASGLAAQLDTVAGLDAGRGRGFGGGGNPPPPNFRAINAALVGQLNAQDLGDMAPTQAAIARFTATCRE